VRDASALMAAAGEIPVTLIGRAGGTTLELIGLGAISVRELSAAHEATLPALMEGY